MYRVKTTFSGTPVAGGGVNFLYFSEEGGTAAQAQAAVKTFWQAVDDLMHTTVAYTVSGDVEYVSESTGEIFGIGTTDAYTGNGAGTGDILPPATQGLIRWRTGFYVSGREIRGRTFVPGMTEAINDASGRPTSGAVTVLNNAASALVGNGTSELVVFSRTHLQAGIVASGTAWSNWASLRSRRD